MCQLAYNSAYHRSLNNTPYFAFFYRDNHIPYDTIYPVTPHEDLGPRQRVKDAQKILEMTRRSIYNTQQHRLQNVNLGRQNAIEVGDLVFATTAHINKKDYKILPKYSGPYRVLSIKFNSATLKSLKTGRISLVSLRNVKLAHHSSISKKENKSVDEPFPIFGDNDLPKGMVEKEIRSHHDMQLLTGSEAKELPEESTLAENPEGLAPASKALGQTPADVRGRGKNLRARSLGTLSDQTLGDMATADPPSSTADPPISSRTRAQSSQKVMTNNMDHKYFLNVELPSAFHKGHRAPPSPTEVYDRWSAGSTTS